MNEETLYCKWHPTVETGLRCYQCNTPICPKCAQRTPVGYLCRDCQRGRQKRFEQGTITDLIVAAAVSLVLGGIAGWFLPLTGWFTIFLSPVAGGLIAEAVWRLVQRRYSERLWWIVAGGIVLSALPYLLVTLAAAIFIPASGYAGYAFNLFGILWAIVHIVLATSAAIARLRLR